MTRRYRDAMRGVTACGAVLAAAAVALAAYASHATRTPDTRMHLQTAAAFAFGHGAALCVLGNEAPRLLLRIALRALLLGTLLFAGSLAGAEFFGWPTRLAPAGGMLLIGGWLLVAIDRLRA